MTKPNTKPMKTQTMKKCALLILGLAVNFLGIQAFAQQVGDPGWKFDESKLDSRIPAMSEWAKAGVETGIPARDANPTKETLRVVEGDEDMADNINLAIERAAADGGGVVLLANGEYPIRSQITMKSDVILRGESREGTLLKNMLRHEGSDDGDRIPTIVMENVTHCGLEDFTMYYSITYNDEVMHPLDYDYDFYKKVYWEQRKQVFENRRVYHDRANYEYHTRNDMFVTFVQMDGNNTKNDWIDNCSFLESGSDHIFIRQGSHITIRNTEVNGAFQKGGQGNGYGINCYGEYVLMTNCTMKKVRHWAIQQGAKYCVVYDCDAETDMNFHQGDKGLNLIENSRIHIPFHHSWDCFQTGASYHGSPGEANMFFNNDCFQKEDGVLYNDNKIYTFEEKELKTSSLETPEYGVLYAIKRSEPADFIVSGVELSTESFLMETGQREKLSATVTPLTATNKSIVWSSDNPAVVAVDAEGTITAIAEGTAKVSVTTEDGGFTDNALIEVRALDLTLKNLAVNKTITSSDNDGNGPENLIDEDPTTRWSAEFYPQWVEIDMGETVSISKTELICYLDRAYAYTIEVKEDETSEYRTIVDRTNNTTEGRVDAPIIDNLEVTEAQFIKLTVTGASGYTGSWASICEFRIWGKENNVPTKIDIPSEQTESRIFPNPFSSVLNIDLTNGNYNKIQLIDMNGRIALTKIISSQEEIALPLPYSTVPKGVYCLKLFGKKRVAVHKIVRQ